jgi:hypothetical protein
MGILYSVVSDMASNCEQHMMDEDSYLPYGTWQDLTDRAYALLEAINANKGIPDEDYSHLAAEYRQALRHEQAMRQLVNNDLAVIAKHKLGIDTLETRGSDSYDFHDVAVWAVRDALLAAYRAGVDSATNQSQEVSVT